MPRSVNNIKLNENMIFSPGTNPTCLHMLSTVK